MTTAVVAGGSGIEATKQIIVQQNIRLIAAMFGELELIAQLEISIRRFELQEAVYGDVAEATFEGNRRLHPATKLVSRYIVIRHS